MKTDNRPLMLKIVAAGIVGLFLLDRIVIEPVLANWREQSERIAALSVKVQRGKGLLAREDAIRTRWADMVRANLPEEVAAAESQAFKAAGHWENESRVFFTSLNQQWQNHDEGYKTLECRISADGSQASIGRFIYELEAGNSPVNLQEVELTSRDAKGTQLMLTARFSFLRLGDAGRKGK